MLTGKCKEDFEKWYVVNILKQKDPRFYEIYGNDYLNKFYKNHKSMQYGVYVDFFDENGLDVVVFKWRNKYTASVYEIDGDKISKESTIGKGKGFGTRQIAREQVIIKGNDLYEQYIIEEKR